MPDGLRTALHVLNAFCERQSPDQKDVAELQRFAPIYADLPIDELACKIVIAKLEEWKRTRAMRAAG